MNNTDGTMSLIILCTPPPMPWKSFTNEGWKTKICLSVWSVRVNSIKWEPTRQFILPTILYFPFVLCLFIWKKMCLKLTSFNVLGKSFIDKFKTFYQFLIIQCSRCLQSCFSVWFSQSFQPLGIFTGEWQVCIHQRAQWLWFTQY